MGLAAGINFSMRSVVVTDTRYMVGNFEQQVAPDELLQMFGRAGRRGLDEVGYALISSRPPRLHDARPRVLRRPAQVDWPTLLAVMHAAAQRGQEPFDAALTLNQRLFTAQPIPLGIEHARATGPMPCGLGIDMERARFARRGFVEMLNSRGQWEPRGEPTTAPLGDALVLENNRWRPALSLARTLDGLGHGNLCKLEATHGKRYGRELPLGTRRADGQLSLAPWLRRLLKTSRLTPEALESQVLARIPELIACPQSRVAAPFTRGEQLLVRVDFSPIETAVLRDSHGAALMAPPERRELPPPCRTCPELAAYCERTEITASPALAWRQLGLIAADGRPTPRGIIFSFFHHGEGLAIAAALEDAAYPIDELIFDLANLRAGPRFAGEEPIFGGRLGALCQRTYDRADWPGYLSMGVPLDYGAGASEVVREIAEHDTPRAKLLTEFLRPGDLERAVIEWRSLLRHIVWAPDHDLARWRELRAAAARHIETTVSPTAGAFPPLTTAQRQRIGRV